MYTLYVKYNIMITYKQKTPLQITVKLEGKIVGTIHDKKGKGFCYVPKGKSYSKGLHEYFLHLNDLKNSLEGIDLFEHQELLPMEVQTILNEFVNPTYEKCNQLLEKLKSFGYTFEYYLDATPYNLQKIM